MKQNSRGKQFKSAVEMLERRRLLSLTVDLQVDGIDPSSPVNDTASIVDAHTIANPQAGTVYDVSIWAVVHGTDTDGSNDSLDEMFGSLIASNLRAGGYFGAVEGSFSVPTLEPYFNSTTFEAAPGVQYTDANGNIDIGSTSNSTLDAGDFFHPVLDSSNSPSPSNLLGEGSADAGQEQEVATTTFTVTSVVNGPPTTLEFSPRPQVQEEVSAVWFEDGNLVDTQDDPSAVFAAGLGITITDSDTIAPTASATFSPIIGGASAYQFTVTYSDNQELDTNRFGSQNILVSGPHGYSQLATYEGAADADLSSDPAYDPITATYQITPPDGSWDGADNGTYLFILEANQVTDISENTAASTVIGVASLTVEGVVSITPSTQSVNEDSSTPASFTVTRTDGLNDDYAEALAVNYTVSGSAVSGTNYTALTGSVTIPVGQASAIIDVQPIDDHLNDANTTLTLTLSSNSQYEIGSDSASTLTITNVAPPPTQLVFVNQPTSTTAGLTLSPVTVEIETQYGQIATQDNSEITLSLSGGESLSGTLTVAAVNGVATFDDLSETTAGSYTLTATDQTDVLTDISNQFTINPGPASQLGFSVEPTSTYAGQAVPTFDVSVEDQYGNVVTSDNSSISIVSGPIGISATVDANNGTASFSGLSTNIAGTYTLVATDSALVPAEASSIDVVPGNPVKMVITAQPTNAAAGQPVGTITVAVEDALGNIVTYDESDISISSADIYANGTLTEAVTNGIATFNDVDFTKTGNFNLVFTDPEDGLSNVTSNTFIVSAAAGSQLKIINFPASGTAGGAVSAFQIQVLDQYGNLVTSDNSTVTLTASAGSGIGGTDSATAQGGIATFDDVSFTDAATIEVQALDGALTPASGTLTISPGAAAGLQFIQQPGNAIVGSSLGAVTVEVVDAYGNVIDTAAPGVSFAIGTGPSGAILSNTQTTSQTTAVQSDADLSVNEAGTYTLTASATGLPTITSDSFTVTYSTQSLFFSTQPTSAVAGAKLPAFTIETVDTNGTLITTGKSKIILSISSGGKLIGSSKANVKAGKVTFSKLSIHKAGTYTLTATDTGFGSAISESFVVSGGAAKKIAFSPQPANVAASTSFNVSVLVTDRYGNATGADNVIDLTLGAHAAGASLSTSASADQEGVADFSNVTLDISGNYTLVAVDGKIKGTSKKFSVT
ncbi:MAG TPA: hypothetical protein VGG19_13615 [Tepidisphaeraceae bacterium]|jgi:hypothetical protein